QGPHDDARLRARVRRLLGDGQRPAHHAGRQVPPGDAPGRVAAILERAQGRYEPGRPAAGAAGVRAEPGEGDPSLPRAPQRAPRPGAGPPPPRTPTPSAASSPTTCTTSAR